MNLISDSQRSDLWLSLFVADTDSADHLPSILPQHPEKHPSDEVEDYSVPDVAAVAVDVLRPAMSAMSPSSAAGSPYRRVSQVDWDAGVSCRPGLEEICCTIHSLSTYNC